MLYNLSTFKNATERCIQDIHIGHEILYAYKSEISEKPARVMTLPTKTYFT